MTKATTPAEKTPPRPRGRPPVAPELRSGKAPRTIRLSDANWAKLQRLGTPWLERRLDAAKES